MKIKRFVGKDIRSVLAQVKEIMGEDAVILSNKKADEGVEIVAAIDLDAVKSKLNNAKEFDQTRTNTQANKFHANNKSNTLDNGFSTSDSNQAGLSQEAAQTHTAHPDNLSQMPQALSSEAELEAIRSEVSALRKILTHQVSHLMSEQQQRQDPVRALLYEKLLNAGFLPKLSDKLAQLSQNYTPADLVKILPQYLANMLDTTGDDILHRGGIVALVGPTGVGKTTTIAKLAARFAIQNGADSVALVLMDNYRIAAYEQLATYGKILGCDVKQAHDFASLNRVLSELKTKRLVLIDTAGMGQRDLRLYEQLNTLMVRANLPIRCFLVMSMTAKNAILSETIKQFKRIPLSGTVLTKLDESHYLGGALSLLIEHRLPLSYITDGQKVPEDIKVAESLTLAKQALKQIDNSKNENLHWSDLNNNESFSNIAE